MSGRAQGGAAAALPWAVVAWGVFGCGVWVAPGGDIDVGSDEPAPSAAGDAGDANDALGDGAGAPDAAAAVVEAGGTEASAVACDGGTFELASGRYAGTFYCPPGDDGGIPSLPGTDGGLVTGSLWVDLAKNPATGLPYGTLYGQWVVLGAVTFEAHLEGAVDCATGEVTSAWLDGVWGIPSFTATPEGGPPVTVTPAGTVSGDLVLRAVAEVPGEVAGRIDWGSADASATGTCRGTWSARLEP